MQRLSHLILLCVALTSCTRVVEGAFYSQVCPATGIVQMIRISTNSTSIFNNGTETDFEYISWSDERVQDLDVEDLDLVEFRMCDCPRPVYQPNTLCPLESTICGVPVDVAFPVLCFQDETSVMLVRNIWPLICLWYLCFLMFLCCTFKGRHALTYCINRCFPNTNTILVNRMLQDLPGRQVTRSYLFEMIGSGRPPQDTPATNLSMKTKRYEPPVSEAEGDRRTAAAAAAADGTAQSRDDDEVKGDSDDYDDDPTTSCTICFVPLEAGDRVGDLSCSHVFHVDCLKMWCHRKNSCPLCAIPFAQPIQSDDNAASNNTAGSTDSTRSPEESGASLDEHRPEDTTDGRQAGSSTVRASRTT